MRQDVVSTILEEYENEKELYLALTQKVTTLITELLKDKNIQFHSISSRLKDSESLRKKVDRAVSKYSHLSEITDISGVRIITYFENDVNKVAKIIEKEFEVDRNNSIDKRASLDPDQFGYLSLHYVCALSSPRLQLTEYRRFNLCKVEIQIRSILQHAWAEIEHDLGYKTEVWTHFIKRPSG